MYRITTAAALSLNKTTRSNVRVTVTATAVIINLVVILILDEIYGAVATWLTKIGTVSQNPMFPQGPLNAVSSKHTGVLVVVTEKRDRDQMLCTGHFNQRNKEVQCFCTCRACQGPPFRQRSSLGHSLSVVFQPNQVECLTVP